MKHKAKTWNYCWPDDPQPGLLHLEPPALSGEATFWVQCGGGTSEEQNKIADRIAALWNAAEELGLTTEKVTESEIQRTFRLVESHSGVIEVALQRIEKLEAEKAAIIQVLGEAVYGYQAWRGDIEVIDPIMTRGQRFLEGLEKNGSSPAFVHVEKFEAIVQVLREIVLLYSCGAIGVLPNGITAPDGSDEGIVKGTPIVEKLMADAEAAIGRDES